MFWQPAGTVGRDEFIKTSSILTKRLPLQVFEHCRDTEPAAAAGAEYPVSAAPADQLTHGEHSTPGARGAVWMPEGDGAAVRIPVVHIDLLTEIGRAHV